jgi:hypothetical protein
VGSIAHMVGHFGNESKRDVDSWRKIAISPVIRD